MGGPNLEEERRPDGEERGGAEEEDDVARPSSAAPDDADNGGEGNEEKEVDEAEKQTTTEADRDGHADPQAQDGDPPRDSRGSPSGSTPRKVHRGVSTWPGGTSAGRGTDALMLPEERFYREL